MTNKDRVKNAIIEGHKTIDDICNFIKSVPRPSIRKVLGVGTHKGVFKRLSRGVYTLNTPDGQVRACVELGKAEETLNKMVSDGKKFDCVFLDPPYFSKALIGGSRGIKQYTFIKPNDFSRVMESVFKLMRSDDSHVYLMLSGARTAQVDMNEYIKSAVDSGFKVVDEGKYQKTFKNGSPVTNVRGEIAMPERLLILSKSGDLRKGECDIIQKDFVVVRPSIKKSYSTQKSDIFIKQLILQSTIEDDDVLDPFAGSGIFGKCAIELNRIVTLIEMQLTTVENYIIPKLLNFT